MKTSEWNDQNVHEWLSNDQVLYEFVESIKNRFYGNVDSAAWEILREFQEMCIEKTPDGAIYTYDNILDFLEE